MVFVFLFLTSVHMIISRFIFVAANGNISFFFYDCILHDFRTQASRKCGSTVDLFMLLEIVCKRCPGDSEFGVRQESGVDDSVLLVTQLTVAQLSPIALKATEGREMKPLEAQNGCED